MIESNNNIPNELNDLFKEVDSTMIKIQEEFQKISQIRVSVNKNILTLLKQHLSENLNQEIIDLASSNDIEVSNSFPPHNILSTIAENLTKSVMGQEKIEIEKNIIIRNSSDFSKTREDIKVILRKLNDYLGLKVSCRDYRSEYLMGLEAKFRPIAKIKHSAPSFR